MKKFIFVLLFVCLLVTTLLSRPAWVQADAGSGDQPKLDYLNRKRLAILKKIITKNLPRDIRAGAMDTFLFGLQGARIDRFKMTENAEFLKAHPSVAPIFIDAESILVRINPLMLLLGQVFINEMRINSPRYQIIHDRDGNFNFDDLSEAQDSKLLKWLRIKNLTVSNGEYLVFDDSALDNPVAYTVSNVDILVSDFTIGKVFNLDIKAASPGSAAHNIFLRGKAGPMELNQKNEQIPLDADLTVVDLPIIPYLGYSFPKDAPARPVSGLINIDFHLRGDAWSGMTLTGSLGLTGVVFQSADGVISGEPINLEMTLREPISLSYEKDLLEMKALDLIINGNRFSLSGKMTNLKGLPRVDIRLTTGDLNIEFIQSAYPFILESFPDQLNLGGCFDMNVQLAGNQLDAALAGRLDLTGLTVDFADYFRKPPQEPLVMDFTARASTSELMESAGAFEMGHFLLGHYNFIEDVLKRLLVNAHDRAEKEKLLDCYHRLPHAFDRVSGKVTYKDEKVHISDIHIVNLSPENQAAGLDAVLDGEVDFSDSSLDIKGYIIISEELSSRIITIAPDNTSYLSDGSIMLGFQHTGTIDNFSLEILPRAIRLP